jgi:enoyl-CoA hydratase
VRTSQRSVDYGEYRYLRVEVTDGIAEVVLKQRDYDARGHWEICEIFRDLDMDTAVRASLVYFADPLEPYDLQWDIFPEAHLDPSERFTLYVQGMREAREGLNNIIDSVKPIVSALRGDLPIGAHLAALILADISVAGESAQICDSHVSQGMVAGDHACLWVPLIGLGRAKRLLLASEAISGIEAERIGLVSATVPDDEVMAKARAYARKLADQPRNAVRFTKRALNQYLRQASLVSADLSMVLEQLGLLDGDIDALVAAGGLPKDGSPMQWPTDKYGDRSHAD